MIELNIEDMFEGRRG